MKRIFTLTILGLLCLNLTGFAQKEETYDQKAASIQSKIWGDKAPEFEVKTIPAKFAKESAVIIAESTNIEQASSGRYKFAFAASTTATRTNRITTYRERVKINDKSALDDYSSLSYQKNLDKTEGFINKTLNKKNTYIGVKIIKADGKEVVVNTSEEVLTKDETKNKQGKLAIPGLEVGDILDYYTCKVELVDDYDEKGGNANYLFVLGSEYPILSYQLNLQYNKKISMHYINANNAPEFTETTTDNGDKTYNLKMANLPKYDDKLWTQELRQYPYIELNANLEKNHGIFFGKKKDITRIQEAVNNYKTFLESGKRYVFTDYKSDVKKYYPSSKEFKAAPLDSTMRILYDKWKYSIYIVAFNNNVKGVFAGTRRNKFQFPPKFAVLELAHTLFEMEVDFDILLVSPRTNSSLENVFQETDLIPLIRINNGGKPMYMCFDNIFTQFNEIPKSYQGEDVIVLTPKKRNFDRFEEGKGTIEVIPSNENYFNSTLNVSLLSTNMQKVKIERSVTEGGSMRDQSEYMITADIEPVLKDVTSPDTKKPEKKGKPTKLSIEYDNANAKAREELKDNFKSEITSEIGQDPQNLSDYKVTNAGVTSVSPEFSYTGTFEMDNFVKRAGNNYIFEVGKLIGNYTKLDEKERQRTVDVYMPAARTLNYNFNVTIPKGYRIKGAEDLNQNIKSSAGSFTVVATVRGDILAVKVTKVYAHNFEKVAQWPKLVEIMDATYNYSIQKVLFEKI